MAPTTPASSSSRPWCSVTAGCRSSTSRRAVTSRWASDDGRFWLTYNGEIYNYIELRQELRCARPSLSAPPGDTEVLLHAYAEWGTDCLHRLNGMFAFALWDRDADGAASARATASGSSPSTTRWTAAASRFASEIKALLADPERLPRMPNDARVFDFLARGLADHTGETMFEGIHQLPPGSSCGSRRREGVGRPTGWYTPRPVDLDGRPASEVVRELLTDAVSLRLRSDVPVGTLLSGGLDSHP